VGKSRTIIEILPFQGISRAQKNTLQELPEECLFLMIEST
jgi:hypothetical protein